MLYASFLGYIYFSIFYNVIYAYCQPGYGHDPGNCGTKKAWRLTPPAEVCDDRIDNDCDTYITSKNTKSYLNL
tara:strand:- start:103 stop:321 length:219 start_codon:yes stop_codon:yes gene_type:complete